MKLKEFFGRYCVAFKNQSLYVTDSDKTDSLAVSVKEMKDSLRKGSPLADKELLYWTINPSDCKLMVCYLTSKTSDGIYDNLLTRFLENDDRDYLKDSLGEDSNGIDWDYGIGEITDELILNGVSLPPNMEYRKHE